MKPTLTSRPTFLPNACQTEQGPLNGCTLLTCGQSTSKQQCGFREYTRGSVGGVGGGGDGDWDKILDGLLDQESKRTDQADGKGGGGPGGDDTGKTFFDLLHKKEENGCPESFRPSKSTLECDQYPTYDPSKLGRFKDKCMGQLAFDFFTIMFPLMVVNFLVKEVRNSVPM